MRLLPAPGPLLALLGAFWLADAAAQNTAPAENPPAPPPPPTAAPAAAPAAVPVPIAVPVPAAAPAAPPPRAPVTATPPAAPAAQKPAPAVEIPAKLAPPKAPGCLVAEFRAIGVDTGNESERRTRALAWLRKKAKQCSPEQLLALRNNRSQWMGTADSGQLAAEIDGLLEAFAQTNPAVAALLYGTPPPPPAPAAGNDKNPPPPKK